MGFRFSTKIVKSKSKKSFLRNIYLIFSFLLMAYIIDRWKNINFKIKPPKDFS